MKTNPRTPFLAVIAALLMLASGCNQPVKETPATAEELSQVNRDFMATLNAKDVAAATTYYTEDASLLPPGEPIITGKADIEKYWQGFLAGSGFVSGSASSIATGSNGDLGYEIGMVKLLFKGPDEKIVTAKMKYTLVLKRNAEGKWQQTYDMWNPVAAPAVGE